MSEGHSEPVSFHTVSLLGTDLKVGFLRGRGMPITGSSRHWPATLQIGLTHAESLSRVRLFVTPRTVAPQAPLSMGSSRQEYWSGWPFPPPGDLPHPGIKPASLKSPALTGRFSTNSATWEALVMCIQEFNPVLVYVTGNHNIQPPSEHSFLVTQTFMSLGSKIRPQQHFPGPTQVRAFPLGTSPAPLT